MKEKCLNCALYEPCCKHDGMICDDFNNWSSEIYSNCFTMFKEQELILEETIVSNLYEFNWELPIRNIDINHFHRNLNKIFPIELYDYNHFYNHFIDSNVNDEVDIME